MSGRSVLLGSTLILAALIGACVEEAPPRPECFEFPDNPEINDCDSDNVCEGGRCVADRRWALWRVPPSAPGADNYEISEDTVLDKTTGLIWERGHSEDFALECALGRPCVGDEECNAVAACYRSGRQEHCDELTIDGGGWRVPTRIEEVSIVDYTRFDPAIDPTAFPHTFVGVAQWTSFRDGHLGNGGLPGTGLVFSRCVKDSKPAQRLEDHYVIDGDTVIDTQTHLRWARVAARDPNGGIIGEEGEIRTVASARSYCTGLATAGFTDWRLPWVRELLTLVDGVDGLHSEAFPGEDPGSSGGYFTATPYAPDRSLWWSVSFVGLAAHGVVESAIRNVRCVRDEPALASDAGL